MVGINTTDNQNSGFLGSKGAKIGLGFLAGGPMGAAMAALPQDSAVGRALSLAKTGKGLADLGGSSAIAPESTQIGVDTPLDPSMDPIARRMQAMRSYA